MLIHASIPPFKAFIGREYLYDMAPDHVGAFDRCTVFGVSSYANHALTFQVLLSDGSVFSYIPITALRTREVLSAPPLVMGDLLYRDCPGERIAVTTYAHLSSMRVQCFFRGPALWQDGGYVWTIDWPDENEQVHLVRLDSGQLCALPNHKLKFGGARTFAPYRKLYRVWRVSDAR